MNESEHRPGALVAVTPVTPLQAVQVPDGGNAQADLRPLLAGLGVQLRYFDFAVGSLAEPASDGSLYRWESISVVQAHKSARVGDWIVVTPGTNHVIAQVLSPEEFRDIYRPSAD